jgi:hypothetical protein
MGIILGLAAAFLYGGSDFGGRGLYQRAHLGLAICRTADRVAVDPE